MSCRWLPCKHTMVLAISSFLLVVPCALPLIANAPTNYAYGYEKRELPQRESGRQSNGAGTTTDSSRADAGLKKKRYVLHNRRRLYSFPHEFLKQHRVAFSLPSGWQANETDDGSESMDRMMRLWNKIGLEWEIIKPISQSNPLEHRFELSLYLDIKNRGSLQRAGDALDFISDSGMKGWYDFASYREDRETIRFRLEVPKKVNGTKVILFDFSYPVKKRELFLPVIKHMARTCVIE